MNSLEEKVLCLLEKGYWKIDELSQLLDRSPGCIRGIICILNKKGLVDFSVDLSKDCRSKVFYAVNS